MMKKLILLVCLIIMTGCSAKRPATATLDLNIESQSTGVYSGTTAAINGIDSRRFPEVIEFKLGDDPVLRVPNLSPPHALITKQLADAFQEQGLIFAHNADAGIVLELQNLLVTVTRPKMLYNAEANTNITLKVARGSKKLTKKYDRQTSKESVTKPEISSLEKMLSNHISDIIQQILQDQEIRNALIASE